MIARIATPEEAFKSEAGLKANCFTVRRFGPVAEGIALSFDQGPNQGNPWAPHIKLGGRRLHRDNFVGCAYKVQENGVGLIRRAELRTCAAKVGGREFYTLAAPEKDKSPVSLVKVDLRLSGKNPKVMVNGRELQLYAGSTGGVIIDGDGPEGVVSLMEGEWLMVYFPDGTVRRFIREGGLAERKLTTAQQLQARIERANVMREEAKSIEDEAAWKMAIGRILQGMVDLINLTSLFSDSEGRELRLMLLREFFFELPENLLGMCFRKLEAALHQVDHVLVDVLRLSQEKEPLPEGVACLDQARQTKKAADESARRARQLERSQAGPSKGPTGGSKKNQASNPEKIAKRERKEANRRKA